MTTNPEKDLLRDQITRWGFPYQEQDITEGLRRLREEKLELDILADKPTGALARSRRELAEFDQSALEYFHGKTSQEILDELKTFFQETKDLINTGKTNLEIGEFFWKTHGLIVDYCTKLLATGFVHELSQKMAAFRNREYARQLKIKKP